MKIQGWNKRRCLVCGCIDERACPGGCAWVSSDPDLCSSCFRVLSGLKRLTLTKLGRILQTVDTIIRHRKI
jgi:hypothetical protein